jgi:SAM-dependent methyltransferase
MTKKYYNIVHHYEDCLNKFGDTNKGVDWPKTDDVPKRYNVMLDLIKEKKQKVELLDFGCGTGHLYEHILKNQIENIEYSGLDISEKYTSIAKQKFPQNNFYCIDILDNPNDLQKFDYIIMNGVFTEKVSLTFPEMWEYFTKMLKTLYPKFKKGLSFNVMSKHVDWEREDLFHVPFDTLANFLTKEFGRKFVFRSDYGLYEFTTYLYK